MTQEEKGWGDAIYDWGSNLTSGWGSGWGEGWGWGNDQNPVKVDIPVETTSNLRREPEPQMDFKAEREKDNEREKELDKILDAEKNKTTTPTPTNEKGFFGKTLDVLTGIPKNLVEGSYDVKQGTEGFIGGLEQAISPNPLNIVGGLWKGIGGVAQTGKGLGKILSGGIQAAGVGLVPLAIYKLIKSRNPGMSNAGVYEEYKNLYGNKQKEIMNGRFNHKEYMKKKKKLKKRQQEILEDEEEEEQERYRLMKEAANNQNRQKMLMIENENYPTPEQMNKIPHKNLDIDEID